MASRLSRSKLYGVFEGVNRASIIFALFVSGAERGIQLGGAAGIGHRAKHLQSVSRVAFIGVEQSESSDGFFRIRTQLDCDLELIFRFLQIIVQTVETAEQQVVIHIGGLNFDDLFVLLDGQF